MLSDAKLRILAMLSRRIAIDVVRPPFGGKRCGTRLYGKADVGEIAKEPLVDTGLEVPAEHVDDRTCSRPNVP